MTAVNFGWLANLFPNLEKSIKAGVQYMVDAVRYEIKALETKDSVLLADITAVRNQWLKEVANEAGVVYGNIGETILAGPDPFKTSREMMQALEKKHGKP